MINYIISGLALIIGIFCLIIGLKARRQKIEELINKKKDEILAATEHEAALFDKTIKAREQIQNECKELERRRLTEQDRAREARDATERLLKAEHERAAAELAKVKEIEEERLKHYFEERERQLQQQYAFKEKQFADDFTVLMNYYADETTAAKAELQEYQAKRAAINEAILRERELEEKEDFYRIAIKENDIKDIEVLRSIEPRLTNREVLNKLIFEVFIKRPLLEMEKRVLQGRKVGGIYKITYIKTGESYIGRSVDIANRWKEHCLSSLNIGTIAHSTFHNVLADKGLWNFTWEVLEEVDKDKQSSREKYWIDFYHTDKQFNQKAGG